MERSVKCWNPSVREKKVDLAVSCAEVTLGSSNTIFKDTVTQVTHLRVSVENELKMHTSTLKDRTHEALCDLKAQIYHSSKEGSDTHSHVILP